MFCKVLRLKVTVFQSYERIKKRHTSTIFRMSKAHMFTWFVITGISKKWNLRPRAHLRSGTSDPGCEARDFKVGPRPRPLLYGGHKSWNSAILTPE